MHFALDNKYPIETEAHVGIAVNYFDKHLERFSPEERVKVAANLSNRFDELGIDIERPWIANYARAMTKEAAFSNDFTYNMRKRVELAKTAAAKITVNDKEVQVSDALESFMEKCASEEVSAGEAIDFIAEIDKVANFEYHYDNRIRDPFLTVFGSESNPYFDVPKLASTCSITKRKAGAAMKKKVVITKLAASFGEKFANDFASDPTAIYESMPVPEQKLITEILQG